MCGIVGVLNGGEAAPVILEGLRRLEYRGYDSAGIATLVDGRIERRRAEGKLVNLSTLLQEQPLPWRTGIGHTRWATHGAPTTRNAHPHATDKVAVVHNGIIENFRALKDELAAAGHSFESDTDSEVIACLVTHLLAQNRPPMAAVEEAVRRLKGAFALAFLFAGEDDLLIGARSGPPLAVGIGKGETFLGSDALALAPMTDRIGYLEDGDIVAVTRAGMEVRDAAGRIANREVRSTAVSNLIVDKGGHRHFMAKEIHEQPEVIGHTLTGYIDPISGVVRLPNTRFDLAAVPKITMVACGTAHYATLVAKYWFEKLARVPVETDIASEFRYREAAMPEGGLALFVSQSGETADTLAALRYSRQQGQHIASIVNVQESTIARESDTLFPTHAGPEIGVASTKAFTCQLAVLATLAVETARARGTIDDKRRAELVSALLEVPRHVSTILRREDRIGALAQELSKARDVLYLGRGIHFPMALEGALKLKEISYIHAEGYAAGELKHGPIALIDENVPVIVIAPHDELFEKTASNMHEVIARGGKVLLISDARGIAAAGEGAWATIEMPEADPFVLPFLCALPVQLLAYHTAVAKGTDVDQPRNLAKSVTVE
jgi:glucosamine--fructose-6-phosphate aminotransferase (isomerizing)